MVQTYVTKARFDRGCCLTGNQNSWCTSADGQRNVRPGTESGNARFIVRQKLNAKAAAVIGCDHVDLPACTDHMFAYVDCNSESGWQPIDGYEIYKLADITFADA